MQCVSVMFTLYIRRWHQYTFFLSLSSPLCYHWYVFYLFMMCRYTQIYIYMYIYICIYIYIYTHTHDIYLSHLSPLYHLAHLFSLCASMWIVSTALSSADRHLLPYHSFLLCYWVFTINYSFQILYLPVIKFLNYFFS